MKEFTPKTQETNLLERMHGPKQVVSSSLILFLVASFLELSHGAVGTAAQYSPPYLPTACFGDDAAQFPSTNLFAAAGDAIWDNGAPCGRQYLVRCISASKVGTCKPGISIQVKIVDYALTSKSSASALNATIVLSKAAFGAIANPEATSINVEFQQV